jgi:hypothetical protein
MVTAGLKWAPDTGPKMEIETNNTAATVAAIMVKTKRESPRSG